MATKTDKQERDIGEVLDAALDAAEAKLRALLPAHTADVIAADFAALISEAVQRAFAEVELEPDARSEYAEGIRATGRQLAKSFKVTPDAKKIYYVSFTFTETGHPYFDTVLITPAEAEKIWDWLDKRQAADLIANAKVSSLDKLPDYDGIMENLRENDMLALDEDEDTETVSSVENVSDLAERFDEKNGTPEQDEAESD